MPTGNSLRATRVPSADKENLTNPHNKENREYNCLNDIALNQFGATRAFLPK